MKAQYAGATPEDVGRIVVSHLQGWLRAFQEAEAAEDRRAEQVTAQGSRIVNGGQISAWAEGRTQVRYTDARTGEVLFAGEVSDPDEGWDDAWFHADRLHHDLSLPDHPTDPSLPKAVRMFLETVSAAALELEPHGLRALIGEVSR